MRRHPSSVLLVSLSVLVFSSCLGKDSDASRLVPEDAYAALLAESPLGLFRSAEAFYRESGLDRKADGRTLPEVLRDFSEGKQGLENAAKTMDFGKPFALVLVPAPSGAAPGISLVLWLPLKDGQRSYSELLAALGDYSGSSAFVDGYAAFCREGPAPTALPVRKADISRLAGYPPESVKAWVNMEALRKDFGDKWVKTVENAFDQPFPGSEGATDSGTAPEPEDPDAPYNYNEKYFDPEEYFGQLDEAEGSGFPDSMPLGCPQGIASLLGKIADNIKTLDMALVVDGRGVQIRAGAAVYGDRALGKLAASAGPAKGLPYIKYLEADALMGGVSSYDPSGLSQFIRIYLKALGMEGYFGERYFELLESSCSAQGPDNAFSFDISLDPDFIRKAGQAHTPEEISDLIKTSFSLEFSGTASLRDRDLYRKTLKLLEERDIFGEVFHRLLESSGVELGIRVAEGRVDGLDYDAIRFEIASPTLSGNRESKAAIDALTGLMTLYSHSKSDRAYTTMGEPGLLIEALKRDRAKVPLSGDSRYKEYASSLPKETRGVYYLSLRRIYEILAPFVPNIPTVDPDSLDKLYIYYAVGKENLEMGFFLGAGDVRSIIELVSKLHSE